MFCLTLRSPLSYTLLQNVYFKPGDGASQQNPDKWFLTGLVNHNPLHKRTPVHIMLKLIQFIPLFGVLLIAYWLGVKFNYFPQHLNDVLFRMQLPSDVIWKPTWGDFIVLSGVLTLYIELFKSTRTSEVTIFDHLFSTFVLIFYLTAWLIYPWGGNSVFLILTAMAFLDVIAGFTITISSARRDLSIGGKV